MRTTLSILVALIGAVVATQGWTVWERISYRTRIVNALAKIQGTTMAAERNGSLVAVRPRDDMGCRHRESDGPEYYLFGASECPACDAVTGMLADNVERARDMQRLTIAFVISVSAVTIRNVERLCEQGLSVVLQEVTNIEDFQLHSGLSVVPTLLVLDRRQRIHCAITGVATTSDIDGCRRSAANATADVDVAFLRRAGGQLPALSPTLRVP